jgi:hypothetical protein
MEASPTLIILLEKVIRSHDHLTESLARLELNHQEHMRELAQILERMDQHLERTDQILERMDQRHAADANALKELVKYVAETCSRTEQMTARLLIEHGQPPLAK